MDKANVTCDHQCSCTKFDWFESPFWGKAVLIRLLLQTLVLTNYCTGHISRSIIAFRPRHSSIRRPMHRIIFFMSVDKASPESAFVHGIKPEILAIASTLDFSLCWHNFWKSEALEGRALVINPFLPVCLHYACFTTKKDTIDAKTTVFRSRVRQPWKSC